VVVGGVAGNPLEEIKMPGSNSLPPLKSLHLKESLIQLKLTAFDQFSTEALLQSLLPGQRDCLKTRPDGTIIDGHHRIHILRKREINVDALPREIIVKEDVEGNAK
jgi:hypothetical protein